MTLTTLAAHAGAAQPRTDNLTSSPDAERLRGDLWPPSGIAIGASGIAYMADHWAGCLVVATGITSATVRIARQGSRTIHDARCLLLGDSATEFQKQRKRFQQQQRQRQKAREAASC